MWLSPQEDVCGCPRSAVYGGRGASLEPRGLLAEVADWWGWGGPFTVCPAGCVPVQDTQE